MAANALLDACTGSNPRIPAQQEMEQLLECVYLDKDVDFLESGKNVRTMKDSTLPVMAASSPFSG